MWWVWCALLNFGPSGYSSAILTKWISNMGLVGTGGGDSRPVSKVYLHSSLKSCFVVHVSGLPELGVWPQQPAVAGMDVNSFFFVVNG